MTTSYEHQPRKRFGQNFLHDQNIINKIISSFNPKTDQVILEIGPGMGALTEKLLAQLNHLYLVEIDKNLAQVLVEKYQKQITLFNYDILKFDLTNIKSDYAGKIRIIGNLPYNISTPILFHLFKFIELISDMSFMLQLEVVDRMVAEPNTKAYGRLSVMTQFYCHVEKLFTIPNTAFRPMPKVKSAIVQLIPKPIDSNVNAQLLSEIVRDAFNQRRKTLTNSLKNFVNADLLKQLNIDPRARAENLSLEDYLAITNLVSQLSI